MRQRLQYTHHQEQNVAARPASAAVPAVTFVFREENAGQADTAPIVIALQMALMLESVEYRLKKQKRPPTELSEQDWPIGDPKTSDDLVCCVAPLASQFFKLLFDVGVFSQCGALDRTWQPSRGIGLSPRHHDVQGRGQNGADRQRSI